MRHCVEKLKLHLKENQKDIDEHLSTDINERINSLIANQVFVLTDRNNEKNAKIAKMCIAKADELYAAKNYLKALQLYNQGVLLGDQESENVHTFYVKRSQCFAKLKRLDVAVGDLEKAAEHDCADEVKIMLFEKMLKSYIILGYKSKVKTFT